MSKNKLKGKSEKAKSGKQVKSSDFSAASLSGAVSEELGKSVSLLKKELFNLRFQVALGELANTSRFAKVRKDIARVKTEMSRRRKVGVK